MLSLLIALPIAAALPLPFVPRQQTTLLRSWTLVALLVELALVAGLFAAFPVGTPTPQWVERVAWVPSLGISYHVALDGISLLLVALTALLAVVALLGGWTALGERSKEYCLLLLLLTGTVTGAFLARDLLLFFVFWEAMLVPMIFLIGLLGGPRRGYAALKFFLYTAAGSLLMLVAILALYALYQAGGAPPTFDMAALAQVRLAPRVEMLLFLAFALAFAIKMPLFPLHSWLPDTYQQTPLPALVFTTMLVKVGSYGLLRFGFGLFPVAARELAPWLALLALIGIIYAGWIAFAQRDAVLLLAYSSMAHLGFIGLGLVSGTVEGVQGAVIQMVNHGLSAGVLFLIVAFVAQRLGTTAIGAWHGLAARLPLLTGLTLVGALSYLGLPGLNGFVGEALILLGAIQRFPLYAALATLGILLAAIYALWLVRQAWHGPGAGLPPLPDLRWHEALALVPLVVLIVWIGLAPRAFLDRSEPATRALLAASRMVATPAAPVEAAAPSVGLPGR
jgi:NADH-quinone oxidoreductase subunit M